MHFSQRAYVLIMLTAVLAVAGIWSTDPGLVDLWRIPAALLLVGLAIEGLFIRRASVTAEIETAPRAFLGREQDAAYAFHNGSSRALSVEYAPVTPLGVETLGNITRKIVTPAGGVQRDPFTLLAVRMGPQTWPPVPARLLGPLGLAWWSRDFQPSLRMAVAPDTLIRARGRPRGNPAGARPRRVIGAGSELHQLRGYVRGDSLARIDWKATARSRRLVTREFSEDQHLDVLVAIDAGRLSRVRAGRLDRFGVYANVVARFAEIVVPNDDRIGMIVFADRPLVVCPPDRGLPAVTRIRRTLAQLSVQAAESDPLAAAVRIRGMLKHRGLIVLLTDLDDASVADQLVRAVKLLSPPHLVVVAGIHSPEISDLARREAHDWQDPWVSLAAQEHETRAESQRALLRRLGAPVIAATEELLERKVLAEYESLRRSRRI
ncbi:MAG TPA: DUF58 domain-containing protein [Steroidobacteraceae bacterium]|nr:DUF58 domain-containing protein [Steroidobacteraceae bacterium]